jgi:hypothetical protein
MNSRRCARIAMPSRNIPLRYGGEICRHQQVRCRAISQPPRRSPITPYVVVATLFMSHALRATIVTSTSSYDARRHSSTLMMPADTPPMPDPNQI